MLGNAHTCLPVAYHLRSFVKARYLKTRKLFPYPTKGMFSCRLPPQGYQGAQTSLCALMASLAPPPTW